MSKILLIEDDSTVRESLTEVLKSEGYEVVQRADGSDLKQLLKSDIYDLIITDLKLPGKNGIDLIREMRKSPSDYEIIIITGYGTMQSAIDALQLGIYDYINKPFEPALMLNTVSRAIEKVELSRKKAEAERTIRFLKDFNEEILESSPEAIIVLDRNIICQYWNTAAEKLSGIKRKDIIGKDIVREKIWILGQGFPKQFQEVLNGNISEKHIDVKSPDDKSLTLKQKLSPLRDPEGKVKGILVFLADSTYAKAAESKTGETRRHKDINSRKEFCLSNISRFSLSARNIPEFLNLSLGQITNSFEDKKSIKAMIHFDAKEYSYGNQNITRSELEAEIDAGIFGKGILTVFSVNKLSSEDKDLVISAAKQIGDDIIKRYEIHYAQHQRCIEGIRRLAGGLAHNLNNILSGILGYISFIKNEIPKQNSLQTYIGMIEESANLAVQITSQLLDINREITETDNIINVNENIQRVISFLRIVFDKNIIINTNLSDDIYFVRGNSSKLEKAFINICINARDAMQTGGKLSIHTSNVEVKQKNNAIDLKKGKYVRIIFSDTGIGMDEDALLHCFDPFFSTKGLGYGLGLSAAYGIIKAHGGNILIDSNQGIGTKVTIYLPSAGDYILSKKTEVLYETGQSVLVIETEDIVRNVASEILTKLGFRVVCASTGQEALEVLKKKGKLIKIVLLDAILPDADFLALFSKIIRTSKSIKIILTNADALPPAARDKVRDEGAIFLRKPYDFHELSKIIRQTFLFRLSKRKVK